MKTEIIILGLIAIGCSVLFVGIVINNSTCGIIGMLMISLALAITTGYELIDSFKN